MSSNVETTRVLRPRLTPEERNTRKEFWLTEEAIAAQREQERFDNLPFINFKGKLIYCTDFFDIASICDDLLKEVLKRDDLTVIGFDLEWPFSFQTGSGKTAVIQISPDLNKCYVLQVSKLKKLPKSLTELLECDKVKITGNNIKNDVRKLSRDFPGCDVNKMIENCVDLGTLTNLIFSTSQRWSLEKLVNKFLNMRINKNKKVRMSKWDQIPLSKEQQKYAAIDAYASLMLYRVLKQQEVEMEVKTANKEV